MIFNRILISQIVTKLQTTNKIIVLYGARQVGKTTFSKQLIKALNLKTLSINADLEEYSEVLSSKNLSKLTGLVSGYEIIFIDEAQQIPNIGNNLKILKDEFPKLKILITGSSSIEIANEISEPLTGRKQIYSLFPFSLQEIFVDKNKFELNLELSDLLVYGSYPEVYTTRNIQNKQDILNEITSSYLYKDILELANVKYPRKLKDLMLLLAYQVGSEVSVSELANKLKLNQETVERYLDLLEKAFIIFRISGFSRNLRKEVSKRDKIYFYDLGVRNSLIGNFNSLELRSDIGELWENFIIVERIKKAAYQGITQKVYFWRTYTGAELDFIEERNGKLYGFELKYTKLIKTAPITWSETYKNSEFASINKENYLDFLLD